MSVYYIRIIIRWSVCMLVIFCVFDLWYDFYWLLSFYV